MTWDGNWSKTAVTEGANRLLHGLAIFCIIIASGCGEADEVNENRPEVPVEVTSLDGRLQVTLPPSLLIHRHTSSIQATVADGTLRYYIGHHGGQKLIRMIGTSKSIVTKHEWNVESERHYAQASEMRLRRKRPGSDVQEQRTIWYVPVGDGIVVCDGIAVGEDGDVLGEAFKKLCTGIRMRGQVPEAPATTSKTDDSTEKTQSD